jgi:hypothetical protein
VELATDLLFGIGNKPVCHLEAVFKGCREWVLGSKTVVHGDYDELCFGRDFVQEKVLSVSCQRQW